MDVYYYNGRFKCKLIMTDKKIQGFQEMVKVHGSEYRIHVRALYIYYLNASNGFIVTYEYNYSTVQKRQVTFQQFYLSRVAVLQCSDRVHQSLRSIAFNDCVANVKTFRFNSYSRTFLLAS